MNDPMECVFTSPVSPSLIVLCKCGCGKETSKSKANGRQNDFLNGHNRKLRHPPQAYLVTNKVNGKQYIGVTVKGIRRRWQGHIDSARLGAKIGIDGAIGVYGLESFMVEWIASAKSQEDLFELEKLLIAQHSTKGPNGYNMTDGGRGCAPTEEQKRRLSLLNKKPLSPERMAKLRPQVREPMSEETKKLISLAHKGKTLCTEHRRKLSEAKLGEKLPPRSKEHSKRISEGLRRAWSRRKETADYA